MTIARRLCPLLALILVAPMCADDATTTTPTTTTTQLTTTQPTTTGSAPTTTEPPAITTSAPARICETSAPLAVVDAALAAARLTVPDEWSSDRIASPFVDRTTTPAEYADRLGLDCGALLFADDAIGGRLALAAWTGQRMAFAVQSSEGPDEPYRPEAFVRNPVTENAGEFLDEEMSVWATSAADGSSIVLGHVDFSLGAAAKDWDAATREPPVDEINLPAEQHALDALRAAGMRNVGIAQSPELGSEEGYAQFISPTGQISVADVAPTGWFDPMQPRYYTGESTFETVADTTVRVTHANPADNLGFIQAGEVAFACADYAWILEPPFNGTVEEMVATAEAVIQTTECAGR